MSCVYPRWTSLPCGILALALAILPELAWPYTYGQQGMNLGGASGEAVFAGPHALRTVEGQEFFYNKNGDLVRVESPDAEDRVTNTYAVNRKLKKIVDGMGKKTVFYMTASGEKVTVRHPGGRVETYPTAHLQMTNDQPRYSYGDVRDGDDGELWVTVNDQVGSVVATVTSNQVLERADRYPFGELWYHTMGDVEAGANDRGFHNYEEEGPYTYFPARHLLKEHGRFIQADSIIPKQDVHGFNRYAYASNNSVNRRDPSGHADRPALDANVFLQQQLQNRLSEYRAQNPMQFGDFSVGGPVLPPLIAGMRETMWVGNLTHSGWGQVGFDADGNRWFIPGSDPGSVASVGLSDDPFLMALDSLGADGIPGPDKLLGLKGTLLAGNGFFFGRAKKTIFSISDEVAEANFAFLRSRIYLGAAQASEIGLSNTGLVHSLKRRVVIYMDDKGKFLWAEPQGLPRQISQTQLRDLSPAQLDQLDLAAMKNLGPPVPSHTQMIYIEYIDLKNGVVGQPIMLANSTFSGASMNPSTDTIISALQRKMFAPEP